MRSATARFCARIVDPRKDRLDRCAQGRDLCARRRREIRQSQAGSLAGRRCLDEGSRSAGAQEFVAAAVGVPQLRCRSDRQSAAVATGPLFHRRGQRARLHEGRRRAEGAGDCGRRSREGAWGEQCGDRSDHGGARARDHASGATCSDGDDCKGGLMSPERVLFVDHTGQIGGAELILLDVVEGRSRSSAFLFEDGPLGPALAARKLNIIISNWGRNLSNFRRDSSWFAAVPLVARLVAIVAELARIARSHDIVYANSQKAFVLAAIASVFARRPLIWHLHDIISPDHFGAMQRRMQVLLANARAAKVIVPSQAAATAFIEAGGRSDLIEIVPNGLALPPEARTPAELRRSLELPTRP